MADGEFVVPSGNGPMALEPVDPAFDRVPFTDADGHDARVPALRALAVGDLVYIPGHVMMVIGRDRGRTYVIHDTAGATWRGADGAPSPAPPAGLAREDAQKLRAALRELGECRRILDAVLNDQSQERGS